MENYDLVIENEIDLERKIEYGIIKGNEKIFFVKVGQNGNILGFEEKYLRMANKINKEKGYTVIVSSNMYLDEKIFNHDMDFIDKYCGNNKLNNYEICYFGNSNGAMLGIIKGYTCTKITKMILINSPLMVNWHKLKHGLDNLKNKEVHLIYGEKDPSYFYLKRFEPIMKDNHEIKLKIIVGADHNFQGMVEDFINLPFSII